MLINRSCESKQRNGHDVQAEQKMGESLGRSGKPTQHRALLSTPTVYTTSNWHDKLGSRDTHEKRGQGKAPHLLP